MGGITTQLFRGCILLSIFLSTSFFSDLNAQCAGEDGTLNHCDKENNRYVDLFSALTGSPQANGTWSDDDNSGGLNTATGELDTYFINIGGTFSYTYTVEGISGCTDNQATVTVTLDSFPGRDNANGVACSDDSSVNLFQFTGSSPSPTLDGTWDSSNAPAGSLNGNIFNASSAGEGIYEFVYTVPAQGICPSSFSTVNLEVIRAPESGNYVQPIFCETDDLSSFTSFDLREVLTDEDSGGTWTENSITNEISGPTDSVINVENIRDTFGPGIYTYTYRVNPINPACSPSAISVALLIEDVVDFTDAVFEVINPSNDPAFICEDQLPFQATAQITVDPTNVPNGDYLITYETSPSPNAGSETLTVTFTNGIASFDIDETFLSQAGEVTIEITEVIDPSTQLQCQIQISDLSDTLRILPLPDLSDSDLAVDEPICLNENATVNFTDAANTANIELIDGTYDFTYTIVGPSGSVTDTQTLSTTGGAVSWTISSLNIGQAGDYTLTITDVINESGCATTVNLNDTFIVTPLPDAQNIVLNVADNCEGSTITVMVSESGTTPQITDGTYTLEYALNGAINEENLTATAVTFTNGDASFNLPDDILLSGSTTITLTGFLNETTGCESININNPSTTFIIVPSPDFTTSLFEVESVCENEDVVVTITDNTTNIPDETYSIIYSLSGANVNANLNANVTFVDGDASFVIPSSELANAGTSTITLTNVKNSTLGCLAVGLPLSADFIIYENPDLTDASITISDICLGETAAVNFENADLADGSYELNYDVNGTNTVTDNTIVVNFVGGAGSFSIPDNLIPVAGNYSLKFNTIEDLNVPNACIATIEMDDSNFTVNPLPDLSSTTLESTDTLCIGEDQEVTLTDPNGLLVDGEFTVSYELSGANTALNQTANITITTGTGSFILDAAQIANAGTTNITITSLSNSTGCDSEDAPLTSSFNVVTPPDLSNATLTIGDICLNDANTALLTAPNLADGAYDFNYSLSGSNTEENVTQTVSVVNGEAEITLNTDNLINTGETAVNINSVSNSSNCFTENLTISETFTINPLPIIASDNIQIADICLGEDTSVVISDSSIEDGDYTIVYETTGANTTSENTLNITFVNGSASFELDPTDLTNSGATTVSINSITSVLTSCVSNDTVTSSFEVFPNPELSSADITAVDICLGENGMLTVNSLTLTDNTYTVNYNLLGANSSIGNTADLTLNNGEGTVDIPSNLLSTTGQNTITITNIESAEGCSSGIIIASTDFEVLPLPDAIGATATVSDICLFETTIVSINGATAIQDGDYVLTYQLDGANNSEALTRTITFIGGATTFELDASFLLESGITNLTILDIQNFTTLCSATNLTMQSVSFNILDPDPPAISAGGNIFCINDNPTIASINAQLTPNTGITWYDSETGNEVLNINLQIFDGRTYYASFTDENTGCESSERLAVTVDLTGCDNVFIPEGFSPNGDGTNDLFEIKNIDFIYPSYTIEIFNRNGTVVYKGNASSPAWDGNSNQTRLGGKVLPNGTYFYIINYNDGQTGPKQGNVYLNR